MAHQIETMAYAHEVPWHGIGASVSPDMSDQEMLRAAGLDWTVSKHPMTITVAGEAQEVPGQRALVRDTDRTILDVVGTHWNPMQNADAMRFFRSFVEAGEARMETAGSLRGGRMIWGLANLGTGFEVSPGDRVQGYLLLASPHESGRSVIARVTTVRVVCANTMAMAMQEQARFEARFSHRAEFRPEQAREAMGLAREAVSEHERNLRMLQSLNLSREDCIRILAPIWQPQADDVELLVRDPETHCSPSVARILEAAVVGAGAVPGTAYGLFCGATFAADHMANPSNPDQRLHSAWFGTEAQRKQRLLGSLLEMAQ